MKENHNKIPAKKSCHTVSTELGQYILDSEQDMPRTIAKINRWYSHGCADSALSPQDLKFIKVVEAAYHLIVEDKTISTLRAKISKIMSLYGITSRHQAQFILQVADALYNVERSHEKRMTKALHLEVLTRKMKECDEKGDHKNYIKYWQEYKELAGLNKEIEEDNKVIIKAIQLATNPKLLEHYEVEDADKTEQYIRQLERKAKAEVYGG